jgi:hypothetical protein
MINGRVEVSVVSNAGRQVHLDLGLIHKDPVKGQKFSFRILNWIGLVKFSDFKQTLYEYLVEIRKSIWLSF